VKIEKSIRDHYVSTRDVYGPISDDVANLIKEACEKSGWIYTSRIKDMQSYALKLATGREVDDFFGCSIVVPTLGDVSSAVELVSSCLVIVDRRPKETITSRPTEFQFDSVRLYCELKDSVHPTPKHGRKFEVQVKTLLEQAWSQATHDFSYKGGDISWAKERIAAQLKAMLDNVELSISQISLLSSAESLNKKHKDYDSRADILRYIKEELGLKSGVILPRDLRRLTDIVNGLLKFTGSGLADLRRWIEDETVEGRGTLVTDLSAYSIILQSAMNQNPKGFNAGLTSSKSNLKVFVTNEVVIPDSIILGDNQRIVRI
jgi:ppGpp synthetase/RelA/SpoT-type nucleotidyltranferase